MDYQDIRLQLLSLQIAVLRAKPERWTRAEKVDFFQQIGELARCEQRLVQQVFDALLKENTEGIVENTIDSKVENHL